MEHHLYIRGRGGGGCGQDNLLMSMWLAKDRFGHSVVIDTAVHTIYDFIVEYICELEAIFKKALICGSGA
jgi:hypothetical protein